VDSIFAGRTWPYPGENEQELLDIVKQLLAERAPSLVIMEGEKWKETTLHYRTEIPEIQPGQTAQVVSWFGTYDREVGVIQRSLFSLLCAWAQDFLVNSVLLSLCSLC